MNGAGSGAAGGAGTVVGGADDGTAEGVGAADTAGVSGSSLWVGGTEAVEGLGAGLPAGPVAVGAAHPTSSIAAMEKERRNRVFTVGTFILKGGPFDKRSSASKPAEGSETR
ncbi:hypothetical protein D6T65_10350 [Arthrobacter frigidicola]|nr:hypothetical protein D6T65_10350 [Arthrobacter frigidicola]